MPLEEGGVAPGLRSPAGSFGIARRTAPTPFMIRRSSRPRPQPRSTRARAGLHAVLVLALGTLSLAEPSGAPRGAQGRGDAVRDVIESRRDVLPDEIVASLAPDVGEAVLGGLQPIYLLVNPRLSGAGIGVDALRERLALGDERLSDELAEILCVPTDGRTPAVYYQLKRVFRDYLRLFFTDVVDGDGLQEIAQLKRRVQQHDRFVLVGVDAAVVEREEAGERVLVTKVWMRLWRVELFDRPPYAVRGVELLYSDRATGSAPLPRPATGGRYADDEVRFVYESFRAATIDAIKNRLAPSLWGRERLLNVHWLDEHTDPIRLGAPRPAPKGPQITEER